MRLNPCDMHHYAHTLRARLSSFLSISCLLKARPSPVISFDFLFPLFVRTHPSVRACCHIF